MHAQAGEIAVTSSSGLDGPVAEMVALIRGAAPIACEPWSFGAPVKGFVWRAERARASILLMHGFGVHSGGFVHQYNSLVANLLNAGIDVFAFDMRGHGRSEGRRVVTDVREAVKHHVQALEELRKSDLPLFVFGHSLGGWVTASSVARLAQGVDGAIISSAVMIKPVGLVQGAIVKLLSLVAPGRRAPLPVGDPDTLSRLPEQVAMLKADPLNGPGVGVTNIVAASTVSLAKKNWALFEQWRSPTLVLHGTDDSSTDMRGSKAFFETIVSDDKTLCLVDGGRHELLNDIVREDVLATMLAWIDTRISGPKLREDAANRSEPAPLRSFL